MGVLRKTLYGQRWYREMSGGYWFLIAPMENGAPVPLQAFWADELFSDQYVIKVEDHIHSLIWNENCVASEADDIQHLLEDRWRNTLQKITC